jgi:membrane dipeptidase
VPFGKNHKGALIIKTCQRSKQIAYTCQKKNLKKIICCAFLITGLFGCTPGVKTADETAKIIHEKVLTVDSHTDTPWALLQGGFDLDERHDFNKDHSRVDFVRMKEGGLDAVFFAAFVGQRNRDEEGNKKARELVMTTIDSIRTNMAASTATAGIALSPDDAYRLEKEGKRIVFIGIENGYAIGKEISNIEEFYAGGARYITLCHTRNNDICDSSTDTSEYNGLSTFGIDVVKEMNRVGMMIDISHVSDSSFYDVLALTDKPVIASHSCARAICDSPRNLNDDMLIKLAENGGVIQVCILSDYVKKPELFPARDSAFQAIKDRYGNFADLPQDEEKKAWEEWDSVDLLFPVKLATVSDMVDHIDHIVKVAGIDHAGIGTDFDGGGGLADCRDASQMGNITLELVKRGYKEEEIRKIWGGNLMRVMREVQK